MLHRFRFVIAGILIILINQAVTFAVSASMPTALLPAGSTRYATAASTSTENVNNLVGWADVPGMTKYITIPSRQDGRRDGDLLWPGNYTGSLYDLCEGAGS